MPPDLTRFIDALAKAAYQVSAEKLFLTDSFDAPIYPESLVQVVVAQSLNKELHFPRIELEFPTAELEEELCGYSDCNLCSRPGKVDMVCWLNSMPFAAIEVKDQLSGTDEGLKEDAIRLQQLLSSAHRLMPGWKLTFGGLVAYVGKNSQQYKDPKPFDHQLSPKADMTITTVKNNIESVIDSTKYNVEFREGRCVDSSKDAAIKDPYANTEDEETLSGLEQMTKYLVAVIYRKNGI